MLKCVISLKKKCFHIARHGECPTTENTETFIRLCERFNERNPPELIGMFDLTLPLLNSLFIIGFSFSFLRVDVKVCFPFNVITSYSKRLNFAGYKINEFLKF